jgi:putative DNA primase/helicase
MSMIFVPLRERTRGRWKAILPALGIDPKYLTGRNGPCPLCPGGRDRWRFDNKNGDGTWICTHCGAGQGIKLAMEYTRLPFNEVARRIERVLGEAPVEPARAERSEESKRAALNVLWRSGGPIRADDPVDRWLQARGVGMRNYPSCLRTGMRVRHSGPPATYHPAMLALVTDASGKPATIHKTYLTTVGTKAPVEKARMFCAGSVPPGGAVRLAIPGPELGLAEGIENAIATMKMFGIPTWAALSDWGIEKFEPPNEIKRLVVFGDNDSHGAGQRAAYSTAARLSGRIEVEVRIPERSGDDWNDVLAGRRSG